MISEIGYLDFLKIFNARRMYMRILKRTVIVIFCVSLLIFIIAVVKELISSDSSIPEITSDRDV